MSNRAFATLSLVVLVTAVGALALWAQITGWSADAIVNDVHPASLPAGAPATGPAFPVWYPVWLREMNAGLDKASAALDAAAKANDSGDKAAAARGIAEAKSHVAAVRELLRHVPPRPGGPVPPPSQTPPP